MRKEGLRQEPSIAEEEPKVNRYSLDKYLKNLDLRPEDLVGKKILDIGGGFGHFAKQAEEQGMVNKEDIVTLDPDYGNQGFVEGVVAVKAEGESVPFREGSFDLIISHAAAPNAFSRYAYELKQSDLNEKVEDIMRDWLRTLRTGGMVRFYPISVPDSRGKKDWEVKDEKFKQALTAALRALEEDGARVEWKEMSYDDRGDRVKQKAYTVSIYKPTESPAEN